MISSTKSLAVLALIFVPLFGAIDAQSQNYTSCSSYFQDLINGVYDQNFENFDRVLRLADYNTDPNFKADVLFGLYNAMDAAHHLDNPIRAIPLFNEFEALINDNGTKMHPDQYFAAVRQRASLYYTIVNKGADILLAGVILHECNKPNSTVQLLLDELYISNETLSEETVSTMVNRVRWLLPIEELVPAMSNLSNTHVRQNVDAMLALYNPQQINDEVSMTYFVHLHILTGNPEYTLTVSAAKQRQVAALMPIAVKKLMGGQVCLHNPINSTFDLYLQECRQTDKACVYNYPSSDTETVFIVNHKQNPVTFNFLSKAYAMHPLGIQYGEVEQAGGFKMNVYSKSNTEKDWQVQLKGDRVIVKNLDGAMYLCAGSQLAKSGNLWFAYTRNAKSFAEHSQECLWVVKSC